MSNCRVCGGTEFYTEAGYYFCTECQTQNEDKREEILELRLEGGTRLTKRKIPKINNFEKIDHSAQWTTWEQYNFILIGLTDELIELGVTPELKLTVLQLWAFYLGKTEVAFTSMDKKIFPKLAHSFHKKDADIIYGKLKSKKRKRKKATSNSSVVSSQLSETSSARELGKRKRLMIQEDYNRLASSQTSDSDATSLVSRSLQSVRSFDSQSSANVEKLKYSKHAKQEKNKLMKLSKKLPLSQRLKYRQHHVTTKYRTGPYVITPMKLWAILYLALRIHKQDIHLADMLRYGREGHLSYYRLDHLLPAEMTLTDHDVKLLTQNNEITHKGMRKTCADIAKFLLVEISCPDFMPLITRYCKELNLPIVISTYIERLIAFSPPKMIFNRLEPSIPNFEGRAIAFIIVVLKVLLGMDGITEYETSRIAEKVNSHFIFDLPVVLSDDNKIWDNSFGKGEVQMDASIMDGEKLEIGSVAAVSDIEHPISLAKFVLENYPNTIMVGEGAKNLSRCTNANWISKGNMVSPQAILALNLFTGCSKSALEYSIEDFIHADSLKKSSGTTGCVAWDGQSIVAGTTTGGLSGKMVGRVGDSPFLGCGTFANNLAGCSLSGHGESIAKLGLSRNIVTKVGEGFCPEEALKLNIDSMHNQSNLEAGGIALKRNGCWGVYFTSPRMPYAVVKKNIITFGADPDEKQTEKFLYPDTKLLDCGCNGIDDSYSKLFGFREWQRYIECRRNLLMSKHFPTKFKHDSDGLGNAELYVRFVKAASSRREEKPEIKNYKNAIPRDLTNAMEKYANMLGEGNTNPDSIEIFPPSLTPQYSYLEQLLENPMYDLPDVLRQNFSYAKTYYLTKPKKLVKTAAIFGITINIVKSRLHFVEKLVPQFEKSKMPSLAEWNTAVTISDRSSKGDPSSSACLGQRDSKRFKINAENQSYYDGIQRQLKFNSKKETFCEKTSSIHFEVQESDPEDFDFGFEDVEWDGKLAIPSFYDLDSDNKSLVDLSGDSRIRVDTENTSFYKKYNLQLPDYCISNEIESPQTSPKPTRNQELARDIKGRFVRRDSTNDTKKKAIRKSPENEKPGLKTLTDRRVSSKNNANISMKKKSVPTDASHLSEKLFIPSEDYWMYHCIFSRVKPKNFELFESELPVSFQWLLNECADIVEMSTEDLYEQVCFVETHFAHILVPDDFQQNSYDCKDNGAKIRLCKRKW